MATAEREALRWAVMAALLQVEERVALRVAAMVAMAVQRQVAMEVWVVQEAVEVLALAGLCIH